MHIIYSVTTCSDRAYRELFADVAVKPAFQSQKYHRLLIEGLAAWADVDVVANLPLNKSVMSENVIRRPDETEGGAHYRYITAYRNPVRKLAHVAVSTFWRTFRLAKKDSVVVVDVLNRTAAFFAMLAARARGCRCIGIVTDLPDLLGGGKFYKNMANFVIRHCTDYVLLTELMNDYLNQSAKPYVVLEGHSDITMKDNVPSMERKLPPRVCLYAGGVTRQYGVHNLLAAFRQIDIPGVELHIYGPGDCVEMAKEAAAEDPRIFYGGMLLNSEIVDKEMEATLLVNPRPTFEAFVKYSFPSKTMEYMASGTPVLTTVLPGMPKEYYPYVYFIEDQSPEGIADALKRTFAHTDEELFEKGCAARKFVLEERNNVVQAKKIITMLENTPKRK